MGSEARVVVVGAGVGGLAAAAVLARAGLEVTVLEAQSIAGGCASTFFHQGYRFDAGATVAAGFYPGGPMDMVAALAGVERWPARPARSLMTVHLPGGSSVDRVADESRWALLEAAFGAEALSFWRWQERTADALWALAMAGAPWPPQDARQAIDLARAGARWAREAPGERLRPALLADAVRPLASHLGGAPPSMRLFVDAQLQIAAQATADRANALYGAAALDLPRRGVVHLEGGIGAIADALIDAATRHGARVLYKTEALSVEGRRDGARVVKTRRGEIPADVVVLNLTPPDAARLLAEPARALRGAVRPADGWGALTVHAGVDAAVVPDDAPLHHQVVVRRPLHEGNAVFVSVSPGWDATRAPEGRRAVTVSTHTRIEQWWRLLEEGTDRYEAEKAAAAARMLQAAERALPGVARSASPVLPGTPVTFRRFTGRGEGWVGGYPQTHLLRARAPRVAPDIWLVGDSVFPGQSTAAVALGGVRVAVAVLEGFGRGTVRKRTAHPRAQSGVRTWRAPATQGGQE